jgi:hypothetical protein
LVLAGVIAAAPAAIDYSTRVKEYEADLLLGIGLLAFAEVVRRHRSNEALAGFVGLTLTAMAISTSVFPVVVGSWTALVLITLIDHRRRIAVLGSAFVAVGVSSIAALAISARLPPELTRFWSSAHRLLGLPLHAARLTRSLEMTAGGLAHGLFGTPLPVRYPANDLSPFSSEVLLGLAVIEFVLFIALAWPSVMAVIRRRADSPALIALASVATLGVAGFLYGIGKVPLGTGRTDLVLYPAIVVLIGCFLQRVDDRWRRRNGEPTKRTSRVLVGLAVFVALMGTGLAWHERSWYPNQAVEALNAQLHQHLERNDALVITKRNSFSWAYAGLSKWQVHFSRTASAASTIGYWVTFTSPRVLTQHAIDRSGFPSIIGLDHLPSSTHRLWLIGTTASTFSPSAFHLSGPLGQQEIDTGADAILRTNGWSPTLEVLRSDGVFARLYVRGH